jgi:hypothetical protein
MDNGEKIEVGVLVLLFIGGITYVVLKNKKTAVVVPTNPTNTGNGTHTPTPTTGGIITPPQNPAVISFEKRLVLVNGKDLYYIVNNELFLVNARAYKNLAYETFGFWLPAHNVNSLADLKAKGYVYNGKKLDNKILLSLFKADLFYTQGDMPPDTAYNVNQPHSAVQPLPSLGQTDQLGNKTGFVGGGDGYVTVNEDGTYDMHTSGGGHFVLASYLVPKVGG